MLTDLESGYFELDQAHMTSLELGIENFFSHVS